MKKAKILLLLGLVCCLFLSGCAEPGPVYDDISSYGSSDWSDLWYEDYITFYDDGYFECEIYGKRGIEDGTGVYLLLGDFVVLKFDDDGYWPSNDGRIRVLQIRGGRINLLRGQTDPYYIKHLGVKLYHY